METNDDSISNGMIILAITLGAFALIGILITSIIVLAKKKGNKRDYVETTKQANSIKTLELIVNKSDTT